MRKLDKKVTWYSFLGRSIFSIIVYALYVILLFVPSENFEAEGLKLLLLIIGGFIVLITLIFHFVLPFYIYKLYGYEVNEDEIIIHRGIIFRQKIIVPIKRIQHVQKSQGPIQTLFKINTVSIFTAGSAVFINGLSNLDTNNLIIEVQNKLNLYLNLDEEEKDE